MVKTKKLQDWSEISRKYPDKWALLNNVKLDGGRIKKCNVLIICEENELTYYMEKFKNERPIYIERTTPYFPSCGLLG